ncbi:DUF1661 domain-containing protein [Porphyromonas gingivalis]|uniref:DUF1661 domain-containing protein n=1 Tax=Porphyromonas gingivalis TaxID=837 RepID=UPI003BAB01A6
MTWKPPLLPDHYAAGESQKSMIYSYLLFLWYVRLDRTGVSIWGLHPISFGCSPFLLFRRVPPSSRIRLIYALEFSRLLSHKTWCENFSLLVWEAKNSRATTKKFSRHFFQRYCCLSDVY